MKSIVSIVVPVYNVEKYLKQCVDSLINQTYKDIEIIFVNDGSTDGSKKILENINDKRVKIVDIENNGVSNARNIGVDNCTGEYITFVDSDDYIEKDHISKLLNCFRNDNVDLCICGYKYIYKNKIINSNFSTIGIIDNNKLRKEILKDGLTSVQGYSCNKMFKTSIIKNNNIKFNTSIYIWEDVLFIFEYSQYITYSLIINDNSYNYRMRKSSATNVISNKSLTIFDAINKIHSIDNKFYSYNKNSYYYIFFKYKKSISKIKQSVNIKKIKISQLIFDKDINIVNKIKCILNIFFPNFILSIIRSIKNFKYRYFE